MTDNNSAIAEQVQAMDINELNTLIAIAIDQLAGKMADPSEVDFNAVHSSFETLAASTRKIDTINVAYAWVAQQGGAGRLVGSPHAYKYLAEKLGIPTREANKRLRTAELMFKKIDIKPLPDSDSDSTPTTPEPQPEDDDRTTETSTDSTVAEAEKEKKRQEELERLRKQAEEERRREAERRRQEEERRRREEERRRQEEAENAARVAAAREAAAHGITVDVLDMIEGELDHLSDHANPGRGVLFARAVREALTRPDHDLRKWLRARIREANKRGDEDTYAAEKKRKLWIKAAEVDRGRFFGGYLNPSTSAVFQKAIELAMKADYAARRENEPGYVDNRDFYQRQLDALFVICNHYIATHTKEGRKGIGSIVISVTAQETAEMTSEDTFLTNTGDMLTAVDMLRLGLAEYDVGVLHDSYGNVLNLGRTRRTATMWQKLALFAKEGVCTCGQCDRPAMWCDVHHIIPWSSEGETNLANLTLQCRSHHSHNNDYRTPGKNRGFMDTCTKTGRAGYRPDVGRPMEFNNTETYSQCAGAKIRNRHHPNTSGPDGSSPAESTVTFTYTADGTGASDAHQNVAGSAMPTDQSPEQTPGRGTDRNPGQSAGDSHAHYRLF